MLCYDQNTQPRDCNFWANILELSMELLCESERQTQYLIDSWFHHNFQNQLSYSPFQEEPITKSIEDMIQTQNLVTRLIRRLDSITSELIKESEKRLSCQLLTNPYIPNSIDRSQESYYFGNQDSILSHPFEHDQN